MDKVASQKLEEELTPDKETHVNCQCCQATTPVVAICNECRWLCIACYNAHIVSAQ